jgi:SAM-dependent methyltransferase
MRSRRRKPGVPDLEERIEVCGVQVMGLEQVSTASDIAATAAFLEIGDRLGILPLISDGAQADAGAIAEAADLPLEAVAAYLEAMWHAGLVERVAAGEFRAVAEFPVLRAEAGYVSWALNANRPYIEHAREFLTGFDEAAIRHPRDGRQLAVSTRWMGSLAFHPEAMEAILDARPRHFVDLGAGAGQLAVEVLRAFPGATALAIDPCRAACDETRRNAVDAGVSNRLIVAECAVASVAAEPGLVAGADVVHAGFVLHDLPPGEVHRILRCCREGLGPGGRMIVDETVPFVGNERERRFSAIVTYLHHQFMGRCLMDEAGWRQLLLAAGFTSVVSRVLPVPAGRQLVATCA